ncbi:MAG: S9 family peptidase [bacterium]|nr:S9 family peptidase [bacterium]
MLPSAGPHFDYPLTRRSETVDDYHGTRVADPYRWLEELDSDETRDWIRAQNELSFAHLRSLPQRDPIEKRLTQLWNFERFGLPFREGERYFYSHNDGLQNQSVLYVAETLGGRARVLLNPNELSDDGTIALAGYAVSPDGRHLAYGLSESGSDWSTWHVRDVETGRDLPDRLDWLKFTGASFARDSSGFYYSRYEAPPEGEALAAENPSHEVFFHRLGQAQSSDERVYRRDDARRWLLSPRVSEDDRYLLIWARPEGERDNGLFYRDRTLPDGEMIELLNGFDARYSFIDNDGPVFWVMTNLNAPRGRVVAIDTRAPEPENWRVLIPENDHTLRAVRRVGDRLIASYLADARSRVFVYDTKGNLERELELPGLGTAGGFRGESGDSETFFAFTSQTRPRTLYRHDVSTGETTLFKAPQVDFDPEAFEANQVFFRSKDGTRVPMFLVHKKGLVRDGRNPTLMNGYGGFNISVTPYFSLTHIVWMEMGGVVALPNLRGGGEYGEQWHRAGMKANKQNVFDDFIAAAEYLIANGYTDPSRLAISGRSNGGLLVGAVMLQRPDLFAAALPGVGVMDMLRFHKFTIGWAWTAEYGSSDDPEEFPFLYAYSPLHRLRPGTRYPATLIHTSDHDDRVVPAHSYKFAAALQAAQVPGTPALIRIAVEAGHGAGKPTAKRIEEAADLQAFLAHRLGMDASLLGR